MRKFSGRSEAPFLIVTVLDASSAGAFFTCENFAGSNRCLGCSTLLYPAATEAPAAASTALGRRRAAQQFNHLPQPDRFDALRDRITVLACMHDESLGWLEVLDRVVEATLRLGRKAALDLDRPGSPFASEFQEQIDLGASGRAVEAGLRSTRRGRDQVLDDEALPARAGHGVPEQILEGLDVEQCVSQAAVADVGLRGLDQTFSDVRMERR